MRLRQLLRKQAELGKFAERSHSFTHRPHSYDPGHRGCLWRRHGTPARGCVPVTSANKGDTGADPERKSRGRLALGVVPFFLSPVELRTDNRAN